MGTLALTVLILTIVFALAFNLANGWNDAANAVATVISTRVLSPAKAIAFGAVLNFVGALFSSEVARTVGHSIAKPEFLSTATFLAAVIAAPIWITWCSKRGLPNSCSHALLGALIGSVIVSSGELAGLNSEGIGKILFGVLICPIAGFVLGYLIVRVVAVLAAAARPSTAVTVFGKMQLVSAGAMAFAHGTGDGQKAMGIITGALLSAGVIHEFVIPFWVRIACAVVMAAGTSLGGWKVMKTLGSRLAHLRTYQGFSAETAAATTILLNTLGGVPISTTHSITGAIMGVGTAGGIKAVRWGVGKKIVFAWIVTFPVCILAGALMRLLLKLAGI
ncbi:MAG: inorganic phosphate transporter [Planctomycetota bacterium]|nr:inorganic phosphate transporter [Planctomycetota bacterium]